jgi:hypothetical protein
MLQQGKPRKKDEIAFVFQDSLSSIPKPPHEMVGYNNLAGAGVHLTKRASVIPYNDRNLTGDVIARSIAAYS